MQLRSLVCFSLISLTLLAGCAPSPTAPAPAAEQELNRLRQQQQELAQELQNLREKMSRLQVEPPVTGQMAPALPPAANDAGGVYRQAFFAFAETRYPEAVQGFQQFLDTWPDSPQRPSARYWLGRAQAGMGQPEQALVTFEQLILDAPQSSRAPAALVQMASLYRQMKQPGRAEQVLTILRARYPDSPELRRLDHTLSDPAPTSNEGKHE
jgi:tol-pal system protein YbgF